MNLIEHGLLALLPRIGTSHNSQSERIHCAGSCCSPEFLRGVVVNDLTTDTLHAAMRGLASRQRVIADNIANIDTPGFLAGRVQFEDALRQAQAGGDVGGVLPTTARSAAPTGVNGNNVQLDEETLTNIDTGLRYQVAVEAMSAKFGLLRTAISGGR